MDDAAEALQDVRQRGAVAAPTEMCRQTYKRTGGKEYMRVNKGTTPAHTAFYILPLTGPTCAYRIFISNFRIVHWG
jgi:hypothetical protein